MNEIIVVVREKAPKKEKKMFSLPSREEKKVGRERLGNNTKTMRGRRFVVGKLKIIMGIPFLSSLRS